MDQQEFLEYVNMIGDVAYSAKMLRQVERAMSRIKVVEHADKWLKLNRGNIRVFKNMLTEKIENPRRLEANIALAKSYQRKLRQIKSKLIKQGGGVCRRQRRHLIWETVEVQHRGRVKTGVISNLTYKDPKIFFNRAFPMFKRHVRKELLKHPLKVYTVLTGNFIKPSTKEEDLKTFQSKPQEIFALTDMQEWYDEHIKQYTLKKLEEFQERDSGWALDMIINLRVHINKLHAFTAGTYCDLPAAIQSKKAVVNVHNFDQHCFLWSIMSALHPAEKDPQRCAKYPHFEHHLKYDGLNFPMSLNQITKFERLNPDLAINVYSYKICKRDLEVFPIYVSSNSAGRKVHLLAVQNKDDTHHFCWIKNLARLSLSTVRSGNRHKIFICDRCLNYFSTEVKLQQHALDCGEREAVRVLMPQTEKERFIKFQNFDRKERVPYIVYADFEALLIPQDNIDMDEMVSGSYTQKTHKHVPYSVGYYVHCSYDSTKSFYRCFRGDNCVEWFVKQLEYIGNTIEDEMGDVTPMNPLTIDEELDFLSAEACHICQKDFSFEDVRVHDHCHLTGAYRGAAHQGCNLNYQDSRVVPVVLHNLSGYDSHFIIAPLLKAFDGRVDVLPINKEKYISFTKHMRKVQLRFIDSFRFMAASLDSLASNLDNSEKRILRKEVNNDAQFQLLTRKGVFPYEHMSGWERLLETQLPSQEAFYSSLNDASITDHDYMHAHQVWQAFHIQTLGEYSDLYMKTDILLLADIFENFRATCISSYGLDPAHYYTLPGYTWDAMLKYTNINLELLTDIDQLLFIERGIRGGVSQCSNRYAKANNKYMEEGYDENSEDHYLMYYDVVNLYGHAMSQYLPTGNFQWLDNMTIDVSTIDDNSPIGYILEVDLEIPQELHDYFSDLPPCPETSAPPTSKQKRLLTTLFNKEKYIIHYRNLKLYMQLGVRATHYHRVLQFDQSPWLKSYIDFNTELRKMAKNEFEKALYKLIINAIFGKTMENLRKHRNVVIRKHWDGKNGVKHLIAKPTFHSMVVLDDDISIVEMKKSQIFFNKPIYVGFCILDVSKTFVYDFHYNYMYPRYGHGNVKLLYTDTDSLIYDIKGTDVYEVMKEDIHRFDTNDYAPDNVYNMPRILSNKKRKGLMSDENGGHLMLEFVGLRSKMYSIRVQNQPETHKSKGLKKSTIKKLTFNDYLYCLRENRISYRTQQCIRSHHHQLHTIKQQKVGLSPFDEKRCISMNTTDTLPWGHYKV